MDCKKIITDLEDSGLTQNEIAKLAGCSQGHVSDLKTGRRGKRLSHEVATALMQLWESRKCSDAQSIA
jgi:transcriptional regulator with XRE-family HTH domain